MSQKKNITKSIRFPNDLHKQIAQEADKNRRSFSNQVIIILEEYYGLKEKEQKNTTEPVEE